MTDEYEVLYHPDFYLDIHEAQDFYFRRTRSSILGDRFFKTVEETVATLSHTALHYQVRYDNIRFLLIPGFPYAIHYSVDEKNKAVYVEALLHTHDDPNKWGNRS